MKLKILILAFFLMASAINSQEPSDYWDDFEDEEESSYYYDTTKTLKGLVFDFGIGLDGGSMAFGFRYGILSAHMGFAGLFQNIPNYSYTNPIGVNLNPNEPLPNGYSEEEYTGTSVFGDIGVHLAYLETLNFFANVGYFTQQDTILARSPEGSYYRYVYRAYDGITFGGGVEYTVSRWFRLAAGYHSKRGVFARFTYTWR